MERRKFVQTVAAAGALSVAGCSEQGDSTDPTTNETPSPESGEEDSYEPVREIELMTFTRDFAPLRYQAVTEVRNAWEELGLSVSLRSAELGALFEEYNNQTYDSTLMWFSTGADRADPSFFINLFRSEFADPGGINTAGFRNDEYDAAAETALTSSDEDERLEAASTVQRVLSEEQPVLWLFHRDTLNIVNSDLYTGWEPHVGNQPFWTVASLMEPEPAGDTTTMVYAGDKREELNSQMNPMAPDANADQATGRMIWDRLVLTNLAGEPIPWVATDWEVDGATVDMNLRDDITWHDGEEFTAEDVVFTIEYMQEWEVPKFASFYDPIESVERTGDYSVRFDIGQPDASFVSGSLTRLWMLPKHVWDGVAEAEGLEHPRNWTDGIDRTGSGPFEFEAYEPGSRVVFTRNEDHFAADEYSFDRLIWNIYGSGSTAVGAVENGEAAFAQAVQPQQYERAQDTDGLEAMSNASFGWTGIFLNNGVEPFDRTPFRQALAHAVDTERIVQISLSGYGSPARSPISPTNEKWFDPDTPLLDGGLDEARQVLEDAGYRWDDDGALLKRVES